MRRSTAAGVLAAVTLASCAHGGGGAALPQSSTGGASQAVVRHTLSAPAGWATTATDVFTLANASDQGALASTQTLTVRLGLALHNADQLKSLVASGGAVSPGSFMSSYAPTQSEVAAVTSYLQSQGFSNVAVEPNNVLVSATASAAVVSKAFDTVLHAFSLNGANVYANTAPAYVPQALGGIVVAVLGLNNVQTFKASPRKGKPVPQPTPGPVPTQQPESPCSLSSVSLIGLSTPQPEPSPVASTAGCYRAYTPSDYWRAYDVQNASAATNVNIAIMAEGNVQQAISDFRVDEQGLALANVPVVVKQVGVASSDTAGDGEWTLDMTASSGMARAVKTLYVYDTTSLTDSDIALEYNHWVTDDLAPIGNSSFGGCEFGPFLDGSMVVDDEILLQGASQGQTMFASSGDSGSFCSVGTPNGVPAGVPFVEYPAASPYVVGVGGTTLVSQPDGSYQGESAWDAGGGGISQFEYSPTWQSGVQPASALRGVPDIAMDGDLQTGAVIYTSAYGWNVFGGTSLSSPLAAGAWARMLQTHPALGYAAPVLYHTYAANTAGATLVGPPPTRPVGGFHDVLSGTNGAYSALPGYDYTTGMGSFDISATASVIGP